MMLCGNLSSKWPKNRFRGDIGLAVLLGSLLEMAKTLFSDRDRIQMASYGRDQTQWLEMTSQGRDRTQMEPDGRDWIQWFEAT